MRSSYILSIATLLCLMTALSLCISDSRKSGSWRVVTQDSSVSDAEAIFSLAFTDANCGWMLTPSRLLETKDGGQSWMVRLESTPPQKAFYSFIFVSPTTGIIVGTQRKAEGYTALILRTEDTGKSWQEINVNAASRADLKRAPQLSSVSFCNPSVGWVAGSNLVMHTSDSGLTWETQHSGSKDEVLLSVACVSPERAYVVGQDGLILQTKDGGKSWHREESGGEDNLVRVRLFGNSGWIVGGLAGRGTILRTSDGSAKWERVQGVSAIPFFDIYMNGQQGWIVGAAGTILQTTDGGQTWRQQRSPTNNDLVTAFFLNPQQGWIGGNKRTVLRLSE